MDAAALPPRERAVILAALAGITALCWLYLATMAGMWLFWGVR